MHNTNDCEKLFYNVIPNLSVTQWCASEDYNPKYTVVVQNIPPGLDEEDLELYFQSNKYSGGGEMAKFTFNTGSTEAIMVYKDHAGKLCHDVLNPFAANTLRISLCHTTHLANLKVKSVNLGNL